MNNNPCQACGFSPDAEIETVAEFVLNTELLSGNKIGGNDRNGWKFRSAKEKYKRAINIIGFPKEHCKAGEKRRVIITRYMTAKQRKFDRDNLIWGCKPIVDILKSRAWIFEDSPKYVEVIYKQEKADGDSGTIGIKVERFL